MDGVLHGLPDEQLLRLLAHAPPGERRERLASEALRRLRACGDVGEPLVRALSALGDQPPRDGLREARTALIAEALARIEDVRES